MKYLNDKFTAILVVITGMVTAIAVLFAMDVRASSVPVGVMVKAQNCPDGTVLVINDVQTGKFVDSRGKLTTTVTGLAGYTITAQMHNIPARKDYPLVTTPARMNLVINLDCADGGANYDTRPGL